MIFYLPIDYVIGMLVWLVLLWGALVALIRLRQKLTGRPQRQRWVHAGLSVWMLLALLSACELGFALFVEHSDSFNTTNVSKRWFERHIEDQRNEFGARDAHEFPRNAPVGKRHIWFIGDSFTIGHGIRRMADRFSDRVAGLLDESNPGEFLVSNLADPGLDISQVEARVQGLFQNGYDGDVVIYVACLNDIEAYDPRTRELISKLQQAEPQLFLFRRTYFLNWLYFRLQQFSRTEMRDYFSHLQDSYDSPAWKPFRAHLAALDDHCERNGAELRVVIFPFMYDVGSNYPFTAAHEQIAGYCRKREIRVLDLEPVFRQHAGEQLQVSRYDAHPNERAHKIAAEAIYRQLLVDLAAPPTDRTP